ncbi:MFS general substrate transporter [Cucurbitaria berberidis CBS 394.84]|uniref:MFS general substrate transporter n=1 Tax=Cucurbitaria berberidis CBS 394.84 TaxID=1168544 RepID=A0A9P4LAM1_9PLEO|nr:MFS general substrate transporter [Cucurbitaria berberidis CBS 394.84]KAF1848180.1 MFS general substrate transporter [Cucurbitaria berberidis CBS 394.84]
MANSDRMEKGVLAHDAPVSSTSSTLEPPFDHAAEKRLLRKIDLRVLPVLWILYLVNFIDRANIGNAKIQGMEKELHLVGQRFNICVWVFNLGYLVAGIPLQIVFKKYGPKTLCYMMFCWGITVIGCGLVKRWEQLVICRLLEGMAEAAYISGAAYLIGAYYTKKEYLTRFVLFCTAGIIAGAINGFVSSLIARMNGTAGYSAWRWIFIIEGCITIFVSIACFPAVPPFPEDCKFLSPEEKSLMLARVRADGGHVENDEITFKKALYYLKDWKIWAGVAMNLGVTENANSLANFQPTILKGLGYTATQAQVHTIPVYLVGAVFSVVFAYTSEYLQRRYYFYMLGWAVLASGLIVEVVYPTNPKVRYMGMFFIACGCYLAMPISIIWVSINCASGYKRAVAIAAIINFGTAGAFVSSNVFLFKEAPKFHTGFSTGLGLSCMGAFAATLIWFGCKHENKQRDHRRAELPVELDESMKELGDEHPDFRFAL